MLEKTKTFEGNPLPVGGDDTGLLENVGGGAADLVPVPGQVLDGHRYDDDQGKDSNYDVEDFNHFNHSGHGDASDLVPVSGQVLDRGHRYDDDQDDDRG